MDHHRKLIYLTSENQVKKIINEKIEIFCPNCQEKLKICWGNKRRPYFKHQGLPKHLSNESTLHQKGKMLLAQAGLAINAQVEIEKKVIQQEQERRVDVFMYPHLALEFQCSPLTVSVLKARNDFYRQQGWASLWILGPNYLKNKTIAPAALKFLKYQKKLGFYLIFLNVDRKKIIVYHHIRKYDWQRYHWITETCNNDQLFIYPFSQFVTSLPVISIKKTQFQLKKELRRKNRQLLNLQGICYEKGCNLLELPSKLFVTQGFWPIIDSKLVLNLYSFFKMPLPSLDLGQFPLL